MDTLKRMDVEHVEVQLEFEIYIYIYVRGYFMLVINHERS